MKVTVYAPDAPEQSVRRLRRMLELEGVQSRAAKPRAKPAGEDCVLVLGGDKGVREYFHKAPDTSVPVLGLGEGESGGMLAQTDIRDLASDMPRLRRGRYSVQEVPRLGVAIDGGEARPALNDAAVFPSRSAMLMEHTLRVNGQDVWHDSGDGVIVSTPMGSSAYSMSAGGPMIFQESRVFGVISVNSLDITRRPLVVSDGSVIEMGDISSQLHCEAVIDGIARHPVKKSVSCSLMQPPARIVRLRDDSASITALARKVDLAAELLRMPPSSKLLLKTLEYEGALTQRDLASRTMLPPRTLRLSLRHLLDGGYVKRRVSARDGRQRIYEIAGLE